MTEVLIAEQELNERLWWSHWAEVQDLVGPSFIVTSTNFQEPLFNHATILGGEASASESVGRALRIFKKKDISPCFFVIDVERCTKTMSYLEASGFGARDALEVMEARPEWVLKGGTLDIVEANSDVGPWVKAYIEAFYNGDAPLAAIASAVGNAAEDNDVSLLLGKRGGKVVGEMALFRHNGLLAAYCVGTVPLHRRSGVAGDMLAYARKVAEKGRLRLVLQTFRADGVVGFYIAHGFETAYRKQVMLPLRAG